MAEQITRQTMTMESVTLGTALGTTPEIPFEEFIAGSVFIPAASTIGTLSWYGAERQSNVPMGAGAPASQQFLPAYDGTYPTPVRVQQTVSAGKAYAIPLALRGFGALKCVVDNAGSVVISLKS